MLSDIIAKSELIIWNERVQTCTNSKNQQGSYSECALEYHHHHPPNLDLNYYPFLLYMFEEHLQILGYQKLLIMTKNCNPEEGSDYLYSTEVRFISAPSEPILPSVLKKNRHQMPNKHYSLQDIKPRLSFFPSYFFFPGSLSDFV